MSTDRTRLGTGHFFIQRILNPFCCKHFFYIICELSPDTHLYHRHKHGLNSSKYSIKTRVSTDWTFLDHFTPYQPNENCKFICFLKYLMLYKIISWYVILHNLLNQLHFKHVCYNKGCCAICYFPKFEKYITKLAFGLLDVI